MGNRALLEVALVIGVLALLALFGARLVPYDPMAIDLASRFLPPLTNGHLLGCDQLGRDVAARLLTGLRWSLGTAATATALAFAIGTVLGLAAAGSSSLLATVLRQITSFAQAIPVFVLAVSVIAILGDNGFSAVVLTLGCVTWPVFARVVQAEAKSIRGREYVLAAAMMQMSSLRLYVRHVLPALVPSLSVMVVFHFANMLVAESALSFLGIGAPLGSATWGSMLNESRPHLLSAPWLLLAPAFAIVAVVLAANRLGERLRSAVG